MSYIKVLCALQLILSINLLDLKHHLENIYSVSLTEGKYNIQTCHFACVLTVLMALKYRFFQTMVSVI